MVTTEMFRRRRPAATRVNRLVRGLALATAAVVAATAGVNAWVWWRGHALVAPASRVRPAQAALVLGALVFPDGRPSEMLADRLATALDLYRSGKVKKILVSGDHGRADYDEVNAMRRYLEAQGVPAEDIFMDHAGFDTYNSLYRARDVFEVRRVIIVTQAFHLPRALYIARGLGVEAQGVSADRHVYPREAYYEVREMGARLKAWAMVAVRANPVFLGPVIAIDGDGRRTHDLPD